MVGSKGLERKLSGFLGLGKKAQVTLLVIVGLVILLTVVAVIYYNTGYQGVDDFDKMLLSSDGSVNTQSLNVYSKSCLEAVFNNTARHILDSDFYFNKPTFVRQDIPYFYFTGKVLFPEKEHVEEFYVENYRDEVLSCIDDFSIFNSYLEDNLVYSDSLVELSGFIAEDYISITIDSNAVLVDGTGVRQEVEPVSYSFDSKVGYIYNAIDLILYPYPYDEENHYFFDAGLDYVKSREFSYIVSTERLGDLIFYFNDLEDEQLSYAFSMHSVY